MFPFIRNAAILQQQTPFEQKVQKLAGAAHQDARLVRSAPQCDDITIFSNTGLAILFLLVCLILLLLCLGLLKGCLGLYCCPPVGMCGLGALIDLPRPLEQYQEREFQEFAVKYDKVGWPVHPQTGKRTVRAISLRTEFCLNVIFFLTYPFIMLLTLLSLCCYAQVYDTDDTGKEYCDTRTIMLTDCPSVMLNKTTNVMVANETITHQQQQQQQQQQQPKQLTAVECVYGEDSTEENDDTKYVLAQMQNSEESLKTSN